MAISLDASAQDVVVDHGRLPLHQVELPSHGLLPGDIVNRVAWDPGYGEFAADSVLTDINNQVVLRVADVRIALKPT